ncbi:MAG: hypothetical protein FJ091_20720 [Deltaproteobacteria bacterium]|nr:hypothetical protein [Deltaproteobacteria bacterium]
MADAEAFDFVCSQLESRTSLDRLAARGTVRIALKQAGLDSRSVTPEQLAVVTEKVLPGELASRGVQGGAAICNEIAAKVRRLTTTGGADTPDAVFRRLGG